MTANLDLKIHTCTHTHTHTHTNLINNLILAIQKTLIHTKEIFFKPSFERCRCGRTSYDRIQRTVKLLTLEMFVLHSGRRKE